MKNKTRDSVHVIVTAVVAAVLSTALIVNLPSIPSATQKSRLPTRLAERRTATIT